MFKGKGWIILGYNTDAINCVFTENKLFPFELREEIQLNNHYWDKENTYINIKLSMERKD